ncbi:DUF423 domain-containing protein [Paenibacillus arenosi]|uniref:DUF423 domain-containing protein n=1 Tax=Paenibacillus arenosi TaxID=2774142 RepID=A0ABR9B192_9BACL|nr:DUF423 domain-containing protein [Paenibacillus arenosi]MBD8500155.1 DUF423 domain-containing protein [Paenibacillus arenosi]
MLNRYIKIGSITAALAVGLGAFGAHVMKDMLTPERLATYETAVQYHIFHALALLIIALLSERLPESNRTKVLWSARLITLGIVIFSGSLYVLCFTGIKVLGAITPIGGIAFIAGWLMLALAARRSS